LNDERKVFEQHRTKKRINNSVLGLGYIYLFYGIVLYCIVSISVVIIFIFRRTYMVELPMQSVVPMVREVPVMNYLFHHHHHHHHMW
jgi:uncharacterized membrane protein YkgB